MALTIKPRSQTTTIGVNYRAIALQCSAQCYANSGENYTAADVLNLANYFCQWLDKNAQLLSELESGVL